MGLFSMFNKKDIESLMNDEILRSFNTKREEGMFSELSYSKCKKYLLYNGKKETFHESGNISIGFQKIISNREVQVDFMRTPNGQVLIFTEDSEELMQKTMDMLKKQGLGIPDFS